MTRRSAAAVASIVAAVLGAVAARAPGSRCSERVSMRSLSTSMCGTAGARSPDSSPPTSSCSTTVWHRRLTSAPYKDVPLDVTLLVDASGSVDGRRLDRLKSGVRDTAQWLRADDRWTVIAIEHVLREAIVPTQAPRATAAVDALRASGARRFTTVWAPP